MHNPISLKNKQQGVIMVISLIMLLVLTLIGLSGTQATSLEEKMSGNARDKNIAFQAAESTLLVAENIITTPGVAPVYAGANGLLDIANPEPNFFNIDWEDNNNSQSAAGSGAILGIPADPRYIIKRIAQRPAGAVPLQNVYRITARAVGNNPGTQIILQEIFVRFN